MQTVLIGLSDLLARDATRILSAHGHRVAAVRDVEAAFTAATGETVPLVVVGGERLERQCAMLRDQPAFCDALILAVVASEEATHLADVLEAGASDFYFESLGTTVLQARLRVMLAAAAAHATHKHSADLGRTFFETSLDLCCVAGFDGRLQIVNHAWTRTLGWSSEELCAGRWLDFVHPDDRATTAAASAELRSGRAVVSFANRHRHRDGSYRWLEWRAVPSVDRGVLYAAARDVTIERQRQLDVWTLAANLSATLESIGDGVIATDAAGAIVRMNAVAERLTAWTSSDAIGQPLETVFTIVSEKTRETVADPVRRALHEGRVVELGQHTLLVRRDGSEVPIADSCAPIRDPSGVVSGGVLVFRDITAERVAKKAQELVQAQLIMADRMAAVGTLAAGVAHEINNPLSYVTANLDMVIEEIDALGGGSSSDRMRELAEMAGEALEGADRIRRIVRGLKTFSRLDDERRAIIDVHPVIELSINMALNEIRHRARLVRDYGRVPLIEADDARLGQVFINLLVNAAHALPEGNVERNEIRVVTTTDAEGRAVVEVRDNGSGIPENLRDRIFDPFFTTKPVGIGTGLGLSICHNILGAMGGTITVDSRVGVGTTFRVVLPAAPTQIRESAVPSLVPSPSSGRRAAILIVDDEPAIGIALGRLLRGHDITVVSKATEALALVRSGKRYDVILSDLMMPEMSGMELHAALVESAPEAAARMIFVTGGAFTPSAHAFLSRVPNARMEKPFNGRKLRELIGNLLSEDGERAAASGM